MIGRDLGLVVYRCNIVMVDCYLRKVLKRSTYLSWLSKSVTYFALLHEQGNDVGTQYRSGIYYYTPEQEQAARESMEKQQKLLNRKIVTEILPAKKFYRAEEYHQQYLAKGGRFGFRQSAEKGCNDPIRCYG